ncbi:MAG: MBL fold metallo-hydrolase [Clostridiales bacterium]|nr:MBL fold metallo-hydrolase [Clostridiales bacterium]
MKDKFFTAALLCAAFSFLFSSCASFAQLSYNQTEISDPALVKADSGVLAVHFLDVGQGDSEFVELPNGDTMLIDAGETDKGITVVSDIKEMGYSEINYLVATHPHSDHIGGFTEVLAEFDVDNIYLPDAVSSSDIYSEFLKSAEAEDCNVLKAESGVEIINENNLTAEFLAPVSSEYDELNNYSAVLKITYENNSFIFMGDAEALSEKEITADVSADVIKVGHHGSNTSSCENFVNRVSAEYAVIECGAGNSYGHPNKTLFHVGKTPAPWL